MRIKNLNIGSFGKLEDVSIGFDEKITVIHGKNEAGKSSIATFIKYMLYGFDSSKKADISENQKKKYMPWKTDECSGLLTFTCSDGKTYTAARKTASRNQSTVFDENEMPVTGENAGEYFLGVSENAYKKTAFIGQNEAHFTDDGELDSAIRNIVFSADESVDSKKAIKKLEEVRKFYLGKSGKIGKIYEIENELNQLEAERDKWKDGHRELMLAEHQLLEAQQKISFNKQKKSELEKEKENLECYEAKNKLMQIEKAKETAIEGKQLLEEHQKSMQYGSFVPDEAFVNALTDISSAITLHKRKIEENKERHERAKENLEAVYADELQKNIFDVLKNENRTAESLICEIEGLGKKRKNAKLVAIILTCLVLTLPVAVFFYIKVSKISKRILQIVEKYGCDSVETLVTKLSLGDSYRNLEKTARNHYNDIKQALDISKSELEELNLSLKALSQKGGFDVSETDAYIKKVTEWLAKNEVLETKCREDNVAYNTLLGTVNMDELLEKANRFDDTLPIRDMKIVMQQLTFYTQAIEGLSIKERQYEKNAAVLSGTLPKPAEIQSRILSLSALRDEMTDKHSALTLAIEALEKASENMRSEVSPRIASETSRLFSQITGGKYKALYADNEMKLTFLEKDEAEVRDAGYLSSGTLDVAYISLRVALCEFLYKEHPTLIFDDAFSNMDDDRLKNTLDFLVKLSEDFQIIILSCHDREKNYLNGKAKIINFEV